MPFYNQIIQIDLVDHLLLFTTSYSRMLLDDFRRLVFIYRICIHMLTQLPTNTAQVQCLLHHSHLLYGPNHVYEYCSGRTVEYVLEELLQHYFCANEFETLGIVVFPNTYYFRQSNKNLHFEFRIWIPNAKYVLGIQHQDAMTKV